MADVDAALPHEGRRRERGFTLIELLVSLTVLAVLLGLLGTALRVLSKNWDVNTERIETLDMVSRAFDILRRDVSGLQRIVTGTGRGEWPRFIFAGTPQGLSFVTLEPPYPSAAGPYFVDYSIAGKGRAAELVRARAPFQTNMQAFPGATPANRVPLMQGPYLYEFAYAAKARTGAGSTWRGAWPEQTRLPDFIRLTILDRTSGTLLSPPFVVAVQAGAELNCLAEEADICSARTAGNIAQKNDDSRDTDAREDRHEAR